MIEEIHKETLSTLKKKQENIQLHMGIAEQGKLYALAGNHTMALFYYRQAMYMTVKEKDPEVFYRHYLECVMESLEHTGAYAEVLAYCNRAIDFYTANPPANPFAFCDLAHIYQRKGIILMKSGQNQDALEPFKKALKAAAKAKQSLPLTTTLLRWLQTGLTVDERRIVSEQERHGYFSVRPGTVDKNIAVKLPDEREFGI